MTRPDKKRPVRRKKLDPARQAAFDVLRAVSERDAYANLALPALLRERGISGLDAAFATELTYGTCRARGLLDAVIVAAAGRPADRIDPVLLDLLRLGAYQVLRTRVDDHAAVSTTVEQAGLEFDTARAGFVNGVLRTIARRDEASWVAELVPPVATDPVGHLAFVHAHPRWVAQSFADALGARAGELRDLLASDDSRPEVHLVARPGALTAEELAAQVGGTVGRFSPYAVYLGEGDPGELTAVRDGNALVQDEGSQLVARALTQAPLDGADGGRWLDLCAGPGGKAALLGALGQSVGASVTAVEPAPRRAELVEQNTAGLPVEVVRVDGREPGLDPGFDRVLVDAPCTGLGALRRRPEARWRRQPGDVPQLAKLQRELLASAIRLTRPGGVVVYATCSPHLAETTGVVADALRKHPVTALDTRELFEPATDTGDGPSVQLWPHRHGTDAMFAAALRVDGPR
ncbi:rRNA small subunit methyltransferase B [Mycobacterium sp. 236(2023)]|uniref:RsmB/NOP family class I SAM-dependent RNA methyltransferase n=1 Tax=Mycobacterium sp. 236(2023) TaxID=3038163 RepID=UPI002415050F|nr:rRNA small subunit methyltransferase B [Mycobacterium sp. 236(2023)]MDG4668937.1 rRNA small subunit methyltransferase B [Mycobacterium sp. 236(2023)]